MATSAEHAAKPEEWPKNGEDYILGDVIGVGSSAIVHTALCKPRKEMCAIKRIKLEILSRKMERLEEIQSLANWNHKSVVKFYTSFVVDDELWLVMTFFISGSLLDIMRYKQEKEDCKYGIFDEATIATVLKMVLKALEHLHSKGQIHGDIKAENILVTEKCTLQIAGFGLSSWISDEDDVLQQTQKDEEEKESNDDRNADIWRVGIAAVELAIGKSFYHKYRKELTLENYSSISEIVYDVMRRYRNYGKCMRQMISLCLHGDPEIRPTAAELLKHSFFKKAKNEKFLAQMLLKFSPSANFKVKKLQEAKTGTTGWVYESGTGNWVWYSKDGSKDNGTREIHFRDLMNLKA